MFISAKHLKRLENRIRALEDGGAQMPVALNGCYQFDVEGRLVTISHASILRRIMTTLGLTLTYQAGGVLVEKKISPAAHECGHGWTEAIPRDKNGNVIRCRHCTAVSKGLIWTK